MAFGYKQCIWFIPRGPFPEEGIVPNSHHLSPAPGHHCVVNSHHIEVAPRPVSPFSLLTILICSPHSQHCKLCNVKGWLYPPGQIPPQPFGGNQDQIQTPTCLFSIPASLSYLIYEHRPLLSVPGHRGCPFPVMPPASAFHRNFVHVVSLTGPPLLCPSTCSIQRKGHFSQSGFPWPPFHGGQG